MGSSELSSEKEAYYRELFNQLDVDQDGHIDVEELKLAYNKMGLLHIPGQAEVIINVVL